MIPFQQKKDFKKVDQKGLLLASICYNKDIGTGQRVLKTPSLKLKTNITVKKKI